MPKKTKKPITLATLKQSRTIVADGPSGNTYRIRPMNMERYALAGGLPSNLREMALKGAAGIDEVFSTSEKLAEHGSEVRDYLDGLVRSVIVEPDLTDQDLDGLPPVDYRWATSIALGEEDRDGEGRRLWGRDPLSIWETFRDGHDCPEDCPGCDRTRRSVAESERGSNDELAGD